ncbi:hypothetical protein L9F63_025038 [Diploptera punctata]|uniref:Protein MEMO1 n=1 Tax=Diploptera punctata TaxID=6984 RepID=A0AAD7ZD32_DIPPU|nr:hypothetical protein L9F63_025038 [Diploptera punctata]
MSPWIPMVPKNRLFNTPKELGKQLETWLSTADLTHGPARAIIAPHAGYQYCGACSGFAYRQVSPVVVRRVFILGPSHHVRLGGCALSTATKYRTPLYDLRIDTQVYADLEATGQFEWMNMSVDEDEHSIEMHLPYIAKIMEDYKDSYTIVPVLVGSLTPDKEAIYGRIFSRVPGRPTEPICNLIGFLSLGTSVPLHVLRPQLGGKSTSRYKRWIVRGWTS